MTEEKKKTESEGFEKQRLIEKKPPTEEKPIEKEILSGDEPVKAKEAPTLPVSKDVVQNKAKNTGYVYKPHTTSIKDALNGDVSKKKESGLDQVQEASTVSEHLQQNENFNLEELHAKWLDFLSSSGINKTRLIQTIRAHKPRIEEGQHLIVELENKDQKEDFDRFAKADLLYHLRQSLKNQQITLTSIVNKGEEKLKKPYTEEEKFKYLIQKNPHLKTLKQQMGLDFE